MVWRFFPDRRLKGLEVAVRINEDTPLHGCGTRSKWKGSATRDLSTARETCTVKSFSF